MDALRPVITDAGIRAVFNAANDGLEARITHIALGDAAYAPSASASALRSERVRVPVGGGRRVAPHEIEVQALVDDGPSFWVREVGFFLADGTLLAVWSSETTPLAYKTAGIPLALAYYLLLEALPADSVTIEVSGPSINLTMLPLAVSTATEIIRLQRRAVQTEVDRLTPAIERAWCW